MKKQKTKAELIEENEKLRQRVDELYESWQHAKGQAQYFAQLYREADQESQEVQQIHDRDTTQHVGRINSYLGELVRRNKGVDRINKDTEQKRERARALYTGYRGRKLNKQNARDLTNDKLQAEFGEGYDDDHMRKKLFKDLD
ncbi:hypothetical protein TspCOW1_07440 [Thiohalobacter sp. COW1]|uniref:hypothetical protein n=1 Tax=Thiohalobacter sp. COW1 TaxID=2795687 RepID=UPI0019153BD1|nr:hypothetical protein [Thiohalobacter sp. COW1]BCO30641.1 hypothetical protein TspCOW1_07440 [Thiohalobacter sp. COW1]